MYTKIDTQKCIDDISKFLKCPTTYMRFQHYPSDTLLIEALIIIIIIIIIIMKNNMMRFSDLLIKQLMGIAMGMSSAPTIADLYMAIHEQLCILQYLQSFIVCSFISLMIALTSGCMILILLLMIRTG